MEPLQSSRSQGSPSGIGIPRPVLVWGWLLLAHHVPAAPPVSVRPEQLDNWFAYIPPSCYVDTLDAAGVVHNSCYVCHRRGQAPNFIDDSDLQLSYSFPAAARVNPWTNLLKDRTTAVEGISDKEIFTYVREDNYMSGGRIGIADQLTNHLPPEWDSNGNGEWEGLLPDVRYDLDADGFDRNQNGDINGWVRYGYAPLPGNFPPAGGSVGDAFIRLGKEFRLDRDGQPDLAVYKLNLSIVESAIRQRDISVDPFDEENYGVDLDKNDRLNRADTIVFSNRPGEMRLVGRAGVLQSHDKVHLEPGLFPESTEFFHSLRYLDVSDAGVVDKAVRVKEIRYSIKKRWYTPAELARFAAEENREKTYLPDRPRWVRGNQEFGVSNSLAWQYRGFIEDREGRLRPQTYQELVSCVGCHSGIGATTDSNFSFARKLSHGGGDYLSPDSSNSADSDGELTSIELKKFLGEYSSYLQNNHGANEYRSLRVPLEPPIPPQTIRSRLWPSAEQATLMNKSYRVTVKEQSFTEGRDPVVLPVLSILREVEEGKKTGITTPIQEP